MDGWGEQGAFWSAGGKDAATVVATGVHEAARRGRSLMRLKFAGILAAAPLTGLAPPNLGEFKVRHSTAREQTGGGTVNTTPLLLGH